MHMGASLTTDFTHAMEELSTLFEERASKTLAQRKCSDETLILMPRGYAMLLAAREAFPDLPSPKMFAAFIQWIKAHPQADAQEVLAHLANVCREPAEQLLLLRALLHSELIETREQEQRLLIAKSQLEEGFQSEIRAGFNLAGAVTAQSSRIEELQSWRDLYRQEVLGFTTPQRCFRSLYASYGAEGLGKALSFLVKGCGIELLSLCPSLHPEVLRRILLDLQCVEIVRSVYERIEQLFNRLKCLFGECSQVTCGELIERLLQLTERIERVTVTEIEALEKLCGWKSLKVRLDFAREMEMIICNISPRLFKKVERYRIFIESVRQYVEEIVILEEENEELICGNG